MRRADGLIRSISFLIFVSIVCYISYYLYDVWKNPFRTAYAESVYLEQSAESHGYIVRDEVAVPCSGEYLSIEAGEGARVAVGEVIATVYSDPASLSRARQYSQLAMQLESCEALVASGTTSEAVYSAIAAMNAAVRSGSAEGLEGAAISVSAALFGGVDLDGNALISRIDDIRAQMADIESAAKVDTVRIAAEDAGLFSTRLDGFEDVDPGKVSSVSPVELDLVFSAPKDTGGTPMKLVRGISWYYAAVMDAKEALRLNAGDEACLRFNDLLSGDTYMTVVSVGASDRDGQCVVLFSSKRSLSGVLDAREVEGSVLLSSRTALRVPAGALREEEGQLYVYMISGLQARRIAVEPLSQDEDFAMVLPEEGSALKAGAEVIVEANDLYDGKVVR